VPNKLKETDRKRRLTDDEQGSRTKQTIASGGLGDERGGFWRKMVLTGEGKGISPSGRDVPLLGGETA